MKKKTTKKLLFSLCFMALCFMFTKTSVTAPTIPDDPVSQVMPLSDMEDSDNTIEEANK